MNRHVILFGVRLLLLCSAVSIAIPSTVSAADRLVVHEWGTFTSLQDDSGKELPGINIDDEPVPSFVHNLGPFLLGKPVLSSSHWTYRQKAAPRRHPYVTMRLETPVIYFHLPDAQREPLNLDVSVQFRGGWLTEFYPHAEASAPGIKEGTFDFGTLSPDTVGGLQWRDVRVGVETHGPETDENVWLAPRKVDAAGVEMGNGESERFLFYRGIGNLRAPLRVTTDRRTGELTLYGNFDHVLTTNSTARIGSLWLTHVRPDGTTAFRILKPVDVSTDTNRVLATVSKEFQDSDYARENIDRLKVLMHKSLVADGLFPDEATALLSTWQRAYFISPGLRLFFLVPRNWTDYYLPLTLSKPTDMNRVMVGRIELFTTEQRNLLARLSDASVSDGKWIATIPESAAKERFLSGRSDFGDLGVAIPPDYQMYLALGRFRNALVTYQERMHPTDSLRRFIDIYALHPYRWPELAKVNGQ